MEHNGLSYGTPDELVKQASLDKVRREWHKSLAYQLNGMLDISSDKMINEVKKRILENL